MDPDRWLGVELRHLAALQAVAQERSFGRAARRLGYTQSAVSQQIAMLERLVGERLLERPGGPRPVSLTEAGRLLLRHADAIVARLDAARADLAALTAGEAGALRVGTYQSVGQRIVPTLMRRFSASWPSVEVRLTETNTDQELVALIERGDLDLTFADLRLWEGPFESRDLLDDPYFLLVPSDSPFAARDEPPELAEIAELPLIGFRQCRSTVLLESHFHAAGLEPTFVFRSDDNGTVQAMVGAGFGVAVMPRLTFNPDDAATVALDLPAVPPRRIVLVWHEDRYRSSASQAFVELAAEVCAELSEQTARSPAASGRG
jgi:DNA-binding transcriptional LysR family regulator